MLPLLIGGDEYEQLINIFPFTNVLLKRILNIIFPNNHRRK
jgi:hypothetical protein